MLSLTTVRRSLGALSAAAILAALGPAGAARAQSEPITEENIISGTMDIDFGSRTRLDSSGDLKEGSAAIGAADAYKFALKVATTTEYQGEIKRLPNLYSKLLQRKQQEASLAFDMNLFVLNPRDTKQKKVVGKWVGLIPIDTVTGAYDLAGGASKERPLRIAVDAVGTAKAFVDPFAGRLIGKAEKKESLGAYTFKRLVGGKTVSITVKQSDPMRFENIVLAKGPSENYPRTTVSGRLDYDYETGNWYTDGIRFRYTVDGKEAEDLVTGSIKWIEDPDRASNGKGYYDFNLRFNEEKHSKGSTESAAFEKMNEEDAFFAVDNSVPCLTGRISYVDSFIAGGDTPASSKVSFALNANKLTKQQAVNFFKLWMICTGPTNDE